MYRALPTLLRPRLLQRHPWWCRNINLLSITYASRPRLRIRLTHGRIILPQETLGLRRPSFSLGFSLLMPVLSLLEAVTGRCRPACISSRTLPYHSTFVKSVASVLSLSPVVFSAQARLTSELLRF